jgi:GTP-binding protein HflX
MLIIKCKTSVTDGVFLGHYVAEDSNQEFRASVINADNPHTCSRVRENAKLTPGSKERSGRGGMGEYIVDVKFRELKRQM